MAFALPQLPYSKTALGDYMSAETLEFHHGKHHRAYVDTTNELLAEKGSSPGSLVSLIRNAREGGETKLFNQSAQIWNHSFFWQCLAPPSGQQPSGKLAELIADSFGSVERLIEQLQGEAVRHFSNGWAWLILDGGKLKIMSLHDADTPVAYEGMKPLLTLDVWEHAYYVDYRNDRGRFAQSLLSNIVNWDFVAGNLDGGGVARADQPY